MTYVPPQYRPSTYGYNNTASGYNTTAFGSNNNVAGAYVTAVGFFNSTIGAYNSLSGEFSATGAVAIGFGNNLYQGGTTFSFYAGWYGGDDDAPVIAPIVGAQSTAVGVFNTAASYYGTAVGAFNLAGVPSGPPMFATTAVGFRNVASGYTATACGYMNTASGDSSVACGFSNTASSTRSFAIGSQNTSSNDYANAVGHQNTASGSYSSAIGYQNSAGSNYSTALGYQANARVQYTTNICGPIIARKDNNETDGPGGGLNQFKFFSGVTNVIFSTVVDLTQAGGVAFTLPSGCVFITSEVGVIVTTIDTMTVQPEVYFGDEVTGADLLTPTLTTGLTALNHTQVYASLNNNGHTGLNAGVWTGATATAMTGRFYWKGILLETQ